MPYPPCLWSTLSISISQYKPFYGGRDSQLKSNNISLFSLFRLWIERSGDSLLNYKIIVYTYMQAIDDIFELFFREKNRWRSVSILFTMKVTDVQLLRSEFRLSDMPNLQSLELVSCGKSVLLGKNIDLCKSVQLQFLRWNRADVAHWRTVMETIHARQLTELQLGLIPEIFAKNIVDPYFLTSLGMFTNLKRFKIYVPNVSRSKINIAWSGPPVLLPSLTLLVLTDGCGKLIKYLTTPSLVSLSICARKNEGRFVSSYLRRSSPPLEVMQLTKNYIGTDDLLLILQEVPNLKIFSFIHQDICDAIKRISDIWSFLSVEDPSKDVLVPKLTELIYDLPDRLENGTVKEVTLLTEAVESRKRYSEHFRFYLHGAFKFSEDFPHHIKDLLYSTIEKSDAYQRHRSLTELFRIV